MRVSHMGGKKHPPFVSFNFYVTCFLCVCVSGLSLPREHRSPFIVYTGVFQNCHSYSDKSSIRYHTIVGEMDSSPLPYCHLRLEVMPLVQISQSYLEKKIQSFLVLVHFWHLVSNWSHQTTHISDPFTATGQAQPTPAWKYSQWHRSHSPLTLWGSFFA